MSFFSEYFSDLVSPPIKYDEEGKRLIASYLSFFLLVSIILLPLYVIIKIIGDGVIIPSDYINFGLAVIFIVLFYFVKKGKVLLSGILFILIAWTAMTAMAWYADGVTDTAIVAYILIIFIATLITGIRFSFFITVLSILSIWIFGILQVYGVIIPKGDEPLNYSRDYTVIFILVTTAIILFARSYRHSLDRVNKELNERIKAEEELSKKEIILREKNLELMIAKDKAEESDRLKTAFLQNISHEIRTPMNGIVGFLGLLQQTDSDSKKKEEYIEIVKSCTQQLATLVNDLIDISMIESGTISMNVSKFRADEMLTNIDRVFSRSAVEKGLSLTFNNEIGSILIKSDQNKIHQVLTNLVSNAIKFTLQGSVSVKVARLNDNLVISVSDTGIGIKESDTGMVFDRFRQAEVGLTRTYGGSGLGLSICKGNTEFLRGKIWFESSPGKGSVFTFSVPVDFLTEGRAPEQDTTLKQINKRVKTLIVEDDEINYLYIKELLGDSNFEMLWAKNGSEAVEIFGRNSEFDVVLMDLKMSVMNGYEATWKIKNINPEIPVIAVTAFALQEDLEKATAASFDGYVIKPIVKSDLLLKISKVLR